MPALLKGDVVLFAPDAILDVLLSIIFGVIFELHFGPFLRPRWREDLPVYRCFLRFWAHCDWTRETHF